MKVKVEGSRRPGLNARGGSSGASRLDWWARSCRRAEAEAEAENLLAQAEWLGSRQRWRGHGTKSMWWARVGRSARGRGIQGRTPRSSNPWAKLYCSIFT